jgi:hypothetical protein
VHDKKAPASPTAHTHFEQIPVEAVEEDRPGGPAPGKAPAQTDSAVQADFPKIGADTDAGHFHGVQFYNDPDALCRIVGAFIGEGLEQGTLAVIIATPDHTARIESCLQNAADIDVDALKRSASSSHSMRRDTLQHFMTDGMPNPGASAVRLEES